MLQSTIERLFYPSYDLDKTGSLNIELQLLVLNFDLGSCIGKGTFPYSASQVEGWIRRKVANKQQKSPKAVYMSGIYEL